MSEIPADVMDAARRIAAPRHLQPRGEDIAAEIANAILAERERCAAVADKCSDNAIRFMRDRLNQYSNDFQRFSDGCKAVAESIRRGDQP